MFHKEGHRIIISSFIIYINNNIMYLIAVQKSRKGISKKKYKLSYKEKNFKYIKNNLISYSTNSIKTLYIIDNNIKNKENNLFF